ncbi:MAG: hypothetical protein V3U29_09205, partial [Phycisphaeraceae bacterium]
MPKAIALTIAAAMLGCAAGFAAQQQATQPESDARAGVAEDVYQPPQRALDPRIDAAKLTEYDPPPLP